MGADNSTELDQKSYDEAVTRVVMKNVAKTDLHAAAVQKLTFTCTKELLDAKTACIKATCPTSLLRYKRRYAECAKQCETCGAEGLDVNQVFTVSSNVTDEQVTAALNNQDFEKNLKSELNNTTNGPFEFANGAKTVVEDIQKSLKTSASDLVTAINKDTKASQEVTFKGGTYRRVRISQTTNVQDVIRNKLNNKDTNVTKMRSVMTSKNDNKNDSLHLRIAIGAAALVTVAAIIASIALAKTGEKVVTNKQTTENLKAAAPMAAMAAA